ncbi:hypothetical protein [Actinomadura hibisca]|uniref:hypothetical protein n=1 Tax=Actinomadura hibisca TaxID=68565 RepID=UPI000B284D55|nr:hypothetical protein [Actinomadura hibisca]
MTGSARKILEIKPGESWLILSDGRWAFDAPPGRLAVPLARAAIGLLPLVERPRQEVEAQARARLEPGDPDLAEPMRTVIAAGLTAWSDHWISRALHWLTAHEVEPFADQLHKIATTSTAAAQRTREAARMLLEQQGLWRPVVAADEPGQNPPETSR